MCSTTPIALLGLNFQITCIHSDRKFERPVHAFRYGLSSLWSIQPSCLLGARRYMVQLWPFIISFLFQVKSFETSKSLSYNLLSGCKETIQVRNIVTKLMKRCEKIAEEMESVVTTLTNPNKADSDRITKQPTLLTDKWVGFSLLLCEL